MSQENVELVREINENVRRAQGEGELNALLDSLEMGPWPDVEWDARQVEALGLSDLSGVYRGTKGGRRFWQGWLAAWDALVYEYELRDGGDSVVALLDMRVRGRSTGIEVEFGKHAHVWEFQGGVIRRWTFYANQAEALEAAGLSE